MADGDAGGAGAAGGEVGPGHRGFGCEVAEAASCEAATARVLAAFGQADMLFTFAGISRSTPFLDIPADEYEAVMRINLAGTANMCRAVIPHMRGRRRGAIVCVGSVAGLRGGGLFGSTHYAASKGGVHSLAKGLAREFGSDGIRVNAVAPGVVDTDIFRGGLTKERRGRIMADIPLGRLGLPNDVAELAAFLASDAASWITGAVLDINGGSHMH